jgi:hypothetical protein
MAARLEKALPFRRAVAASDVGVGIGIGIDIVACHVESFLGLKSLWSMSISIPTPRDSNNRAVAKEL